jgi:hypothetical protein
MDRNRDLHRLLTEEGLRDGVDVPLYQVVTSACWSAEWPKYCQLRGWAKGMNKLGGHMGRVGEWVGELGRCVMTLKKTWKAS